VYWGEFGRKSEKFNEKMGFAQKMRGEFGKNDGKELMCR